jgi:hypothetical protein
MELTKKVEQLIMELAHQYAQKFNYEPMRAIFYPDYERKLLFVYIKTESGKEYREVVEID